MKPISIIVAASENNVIGKDKHLPWHLSDDLRNFKKLTIGHKIIMGYNTYLSLPHGALPNRTNIVLTTKNIELKDCLIANTFEQAIEYMDPDLENFIIGGESVYKQFLPIAKKMYFTRVNGNVDGDIYFPKYDETKWKIVHRQLFLHNVSNDYDFTIFTSIRND